MFLLHHRILKMRIINAVTSDASIPANSIVAFIQWKRESQPEKIFSDFFFVCDLLRSWAKTFTLENWHCIQLKTIATEQLNDTPVSSTIIGIEITIFQDVYRSCLFRFQDQFWKRQLWWYHCCQTAVNWLVMMKTVSWLVNYVVKNNRDTNMSAIFQ